MEKWRVGRSCAGRWLAAGMRREMHSRVFMSPSGSPPSLGATLYAVRALAFFRASGGKRSGRFIREGEVLRQRSNKRQKRQRLSMKMVWCCLHCSPRRGWVMLDILKLAASLRDKPSLFLYSQKRSVALN